MSLQGIEWNALSVDLVGGLQFDNISGFGRRAVSVYELNVIGAYAG